MHLFLLNKQKVKGEQAKYYPKIRFFICIFKLTFIAIFSLWNTWCEGQRVSKLDACAFMYIKTTCHYKCRMISTKGNKTVFLVPIYADSFTRFAKIKALSPASVVHTSCLVSWYFFAVCSLFFILHLMPWPTVSRFVCVNIEKNKCNFEMRYFESSVMFLRLNPYTEKKDNSKTTFNICIYMFVLTKIHIMHDLFTRSNAFECSPTELRKWR